MLQYPVWKRCYELDIVSQDTVLLMHESDPHLLRGQLYALVAPLLDGSRSTEEIADALSSDASAAEVFYALDRLAGAGHVVEHDRAMRHDAAFWQALGVDTRSLASRLRETPIALSSEGRSSPEPLRRALAALKVEVADDAALSVVVTNDYLASGLEERNRRALKDDVPWMLVKLAGTAAWLGPIFRPGVTGCWECLAQRLRGHRPLQT
ncbi:MAG TPA: TOMM precursor leader peptide-binding protein, partial [Polyangiaceae bacterium]|nr:TOMM precursor leader peptide-binding protein [Polyangiaceae bacterium]